MWQSMRLQRVGHHLVTETQQQQSELKMCVSDSVVLVYDSRSLYITRDIAQDKTVWVKTEELSITDASSAKRCCQMCSYFTQLM